MKLYTRTGDGGQTSLFGGARVSKADSRIEACGDVDELNAWLGLVRAPGLDADVDAALDGIQRDLFAVGASIADPGRRRAGQADRTVVGPDDVARLEDLIDTFDAEPPPLTRFILPGGAPDGSAMHIARAVCRRAERRIVALEPPADAEVVRYVNRLSDLLFALARAVNHRGGRAESQW
jgi:cob(I)alamin adenosyltransferase